MMIAAVMADTTMTIPMITTNNSRDGDDVHLCAPFTHSICTVLQCPDVSVNVFVIIVIIMPGLRVLLSYR